MNFKHVYLFLVLSGTFHLKMYSEATFAFRSHGEKLPRQVGLPGVVQRVTHLSRLPQDNENSCEQLQASDRAPRQR